MLINVKIVGCRQASYRDLVSLEQQKVKENYVEELQQTRALLLDLRCCWSSHNGSMFRCVSNSYFETCGIVGLRFKKFSFSCFENIKRLKDRCECYFLLGSFETSLWSKSNFSSQIFLAADAGASQKGRGAAGKVSDGRWWSRQGSTVAMRLLSLSTVDLSMKPFGSNDRFGAATIRTTLVFGFFLFADLDTKFAQEVRQVKMIGFNYDMWWLNPSCNTLSIKTLRARSRLQKKLHLRACHRMPSAAKCKGPLSVCLEKLTCGYLVDEAQPFFWKSVGPGFFETKGL